MKITIDGIELELEKSVTVLEAAKSIGINIPHFCQHPMLDLWGGCRMCLVEIEKVPRLQAACTLYVTDGMIIRTESEAISKARKGVLELILANHPLDCPICDKAGECKLQDYTMKYGPTLGRFRDEKRKFPESLADPMIVRNMERCIMCTRCVRMCSGVQGAFAIAATSRGGHSVIEPFSGGKYDCEYCGNCLSVCPVGAIMSKLHRYKYRTWQMDCVVGTVCSYCGVGCTLNLEVRGNTIMKVNAPKKGGVNNGILCSRGRFGYKYVESNERLTKPMIKKNGKLVEADWDEAIQAVVNGLSSVKQQHGGKAIAGIASARCTNEENYLFQKLMRSGFSTNNIDSAARLGLAGARKLIEDTLGQKATAANISDIRRSKTILVMGGDPTRINPVLGVNVRQAYRGGTAVITVGNAPGLKRHNTMGASGRSASDGLFMSALAGELIKGVNLSGANPAFEQKIKSMETAKAESLDADSAKALEKIVGLMKDSDSVSLVIGRDVYASSERLTAALAVAYMTNARVYLLSERPNEHGLCDMGCLPDALPGGVGLGDASLIENTWGTKISPEPGVTLMEMFDGAASGTIKAMYVMGDNPAFSLPDSNKVKDAMGKLDFLVVQDIFMTETAEMADVVLPALSWSEKEGTYTNLERRIQLVKLATNGDGHTDWQILAALGQKLGLRMDYASAEEIMLEIAAVSPLHESLDYASISNGSATWPYKSEPSSQSPAMPDIPVQMPKAGPASGLRLVIEKPLYHSGTLSRHSDALNTIYSGPALLVHPATAKEIAISSDDTVRVSTGKGSLILKVRLDEDIEEGVVSVSNNFRSSGGMGLFGYSLDPITKAPLIIATDVRVEKEQAG